MWRLVLMLVGALVLAGCAAAGDSGAGEDGQPTASAPHPRHPAHAVGAGMAYLAHDHPDAYVLDGYTNLRLPPPGPISDESANRIRARAAGCAAPSQPFPAADRAAIQAAFAGRTIHFVDDPTGLSKLGSTGAPLLGAVHPDLHGQRGRVTVLRCGPPARKVPVDVQWDGHAWRALVTG
jgi:hypothetical protein